ncbi:uncharacterized protein LOC105188609 isoform X2 [Harpegnathos saltator]|uniref:uncharacterized protein LOC105188609 isoform X2 n=1 Tax=Harpegnathos saltator TaxID=610380 RepID=UPI000DBEE2B8|nr:uncharacterized protein LOC105188609 isoform X2 [Harpegnathos saltator]
MTRVRTRRHLSRLLLLFSSSGALQTGHCLTLLLLGLTSLRTVLPCDEKTRPQSRDPSALPCHIEVRRYSRRDLGALGVIPEWMRAESGAPSMTGQSVNEAAGGDYRRASDSLEDARSREDGFGRVVTGRTYTGDGSLVSAISDRVRESETAINYPRREAVDRLDVTAENRRASGAIDFGSMGQSKGSAKNWLDHSAGKRGGGDAPVSQTAPYYSEKQAVSEIQFQDNRDSDNETSLAISDGPGQSASDLAESPAHEHDAEAELIRAPIDYPNQSGSRESSNINQPRGLTTTPSSRQDRNEVGTDVDGETLVNRADERTSDYYLAYRSSRGNEASSGRGDIDGAAARNRDEDSPGTARGGDGETAGLLEFATRQTHLDARNIYPLDNRSAVVIGTRDGSGSKIADYLGEGNNLDAANVSTNSPSDPDVGATAADTLLDDDFGDDGSDPIVGRVEFDENSASENGSDGKSVYADDFSESLGGTEGNSIACAHDSVCRESDDNDIRIVRAKKLADGSNGVRGVGGFSQVNDVSTIPANDSDTDIDVDNEAPFTGFEGSQKFPVKVNQKTPAVAQVEKFDRRHFGPHKEDVLDETSTWYPSTVAPDLPKSPARDVPHRHRKTNAASDDVIETTEGNGSGDGVIERDEKRNDTLEESFWLPGASSGGRSPSSPAVKPSPGEKFTTTADITDGADLESATRHGNDSSDPGRMDIGVTVSSAKSIEKINITILGLFEMTHGAVPRPEGSNELQAAKLAVDRVNELNVSKYFRLRLIHNDTKCDSGVAVDRFFHALYSTRKKHLMPFLLGTACSEVTETLAKIVPYWNVIQVSFGSTAPALSDSNEFPLFLRTVAPDSSHNPARIALIKHFGWDTVTALSQTGDMYSLAVNDLVTELEQANITCSATITFAENDYKEQLRTLKELDTRIIIGSFSTRLAQRVFCEAWKLGMHGGDYAWILPSDTIDLSEMTGDWWYAGMGECSPSQLSQTLDGLIIVKSHATIVGDEISASGLTSAKFASELANRGVAHSKFAGQTYDAVWAMALALARTEVLLNRQNESMARYTHTRKDLTYRLLEQLKLLHFIGVSGPVSFDDADRVGITAFYQMHGHVIRRIAIYNPEDGKLIMNCPGCAATRWPGGQVPAARRVFRLRMVTIAPAAFLTVTCIASIGVILALAFLAFNLHFRKHKSIKLSSPRLNNMAAVGCVLVYGAVILLGLDDATLPDSDGYYPAVCTARVYLLSAGFSLAFGSMFTKTYRVHRIFTRSRSGVVKNKLLQDTQLISLICVLLLIDCLIVTLWVTLDPMQRHLRNLTLEISPQDRGVVYQPQVEVCRSQYTNGWLLALYVYKGLLLVVGVYMAWETRHVKIPALNDSQYIGMSVYLVVITSSIVVVLANLMPDRATLAFVTITALILSSTTVTLALLFLPQLANILAGERADPVVQSLGLKIECNTRRFVTDDRRELQYRVEVQNRVYRREMAQLELELARLEKQLAQETLEPSHGSSSASISQRNPSIGGGLPLLLLSVLPPVIPRASWPSADSSDVRERHTSRYRSI